jgi:hypothetical protein
MSRLRQDLCAILTVLVVPLDIGCPTRTIYYDAGGEAGSATRSEGGVGGGAGASGQKRSLGSACSDPTDCGTGFCSGGICCDSACDQACEQCSPSGNCQMAADDARCGTIPCPEDSACVDFATAITSERCAARGRCKSQQDCPFVALPPSTYCGGSPSAPLFCDGAGSCDRHPTVACGADTSCPTAPGACCYDTSSSAQTTVCAPDAGTCKPANTAQPCFATAVQCDSPKDCSPGSVCCYACGLGWTIATASCVPSGQCDQNSSATSTSSHEWICEQDSDCASGYKCQPAGLNDYLPAGYKLCKPAA